MFDLVIAGGTAAQARLLPATGPADDLPQVQGLARLGCALLEDGPVNVTEPGHICVPGVFAAGDQELLSGGVSAGPAGQQEDRPAGGPGVSSSTTGK
jgi:hypothetical protein